MKRYIFLFSTVFIIIAGLLIVNFNNERNIKKIDVYRVNAGTISVFVQCSGKIEAKSQKEIYSDKTAFVNDVNVKLGQSVNTGDTLADVTFQDTQVTPDLSGINSIDDLKNLPGFPAFQNILNNQNKQIVTDNTIKSSIKGIITELNIKEDSYTSTSKPMFVISDLSSLLVRCQVPESQISSVKKGQKAKITGTGFQNSEYVAQVMSIAPIARENLVSTTGQTTVEVLLKIYNPDDKLKPGFSTDVKILSAQKDNVIRIPFETIMQDNKNNEFVYVYKNGYIKKKIIKSGLESVNEVEVSGLSDGEFIVYNPDDTLYNGQRVKARLYQ